MNNKEIFPKVLFLIAILGFVIIAFISLNSRYIQSEIENEIIALDEQKAEYQVTITQLEKDKIKHEIKFVEKTIGSYPKQACSQSWRKFGVFKIPRITCEAPKMAAQAVTKVKVPIVTETINTEVVKQLASLQVKLTEQNKAITELYEKKQNVEKPFGVNKQVVSAIFSFIILLSALFVVLSGKYKTASEKWAFGAVGTILGYWLG